MTGDELDDLLARSRRPAPRRVRTAADAPKRVIGYLRVSTDEQGASGLGIDAQRAAIEAEAGRRGWPVVQWVEDICSGATPPADRVGLADVLDDLRRGIADALMVMRVDRLSRSLYDFAGLTKRATREGWGLVAADVDLDTSTPAGRAMANMLGVFAELERDLISARTREALARKRARGEPVNASVSIIPGDVRDRILRESAGGAGLTAIAEGLNRDRVPTVRGGRRWYPSTVRAALKSIHYDSDLRRARERVAAG